MRRNFGAGAERLIGEPCRPVVGAILPLLLRLSRRRRLMIGFENDFDAISYKWMWKQQNVFHAREKENTNITKTPPSTSKKQNTVMEKIRKDETRNFATDFATHMVHGRQPK